MNWLDTETKAILKREREPRLAPPKAAEFALILIRKGTDDRRLVRAIRRINECDESAAIELSRLSTPVTINARRHWRGIGEPRHLAITHA